jgi:hypothetical protein
MHTLQQLADAGSLILTSKIEELPKRPPEDRLDCHTRIEGAVGILKDDLDPPSSTRFTLPCETAEHLPLEEDLT